MSQSPPLSPGAPTPAESGTDATGGVIPYKNPLALTSYYCGIFGWFLPIIGGVIAVVLGIKGYRAYKRMPQIRGQVHAWVGIIGGGLSILFWGGCIGIPVVAGIIASLSGAK